MNKTLQDLRVSIDDIDRKIHSLLVERAEVVAAIGRIKSSTESISSCGNLRIDRECDVIRTRIHEHKGKFPLNSLIRIWREIISASLRIEGDFSVAVHARKNFASFQFLQNVRDYFGSHTDMRIYSSSIAAVNAVNKNKADVAAFPIFSADKNVDKLWLIKDIPLKIALRLPIIREKNDLSADAFVLAKGDCHPMENDISVLRVFSSQSVAELTRFFADCGITGVVLEASCQAKDINSRFYLLTVNDYVALNDSRLQKFIKMPKVMKAEVLGWYPILK